MEYIRLKNSDLKVSRLCLGGCPLGEYGWGKTDNRDLIQAVECAIEHGINFFDTADTYGLGKSEENYGKVIKKKRDKVIVATKFGVRIENGKTFYDNSPAWIEKALEGSLKRLGTDYIDLYQIHYRDGKTEIGEVVDALQRYKTKGYIRYYGLSNIHEQDKQELKKLKGKFVSFQDEYSLACRKNEKAILELKEELLLSPLTWGSLGQGILTGKYDKSSVFGKDDRRSRSVYVNFHGEKLEKNLKIVEVLKQIAEKKNISVAAVALRFILDYIEDSVVLAGVKREAQVLSNMEALGWTLTKGEIEKLIQVSN